MSTFMPWKIVHLELTEGLSPIPSEASIQGLYVVFWWHALPLGQQTIPAEQLPLSVPQLAERAIAAITPAIGHYLMERDGLPRPTQETSSGLSATLACKDSLRKLWERFSPSEERGEEGPLSVVICTRDRPEALKRCLHSLQHLSQHPREILVIDNAPSSAATRQMVADWPAVRYVLEPRPGLDVARNTGVRHSTGEFIAFIDDDVTVHPDWLRRLQQGFQDPEVMAVTGLVLPAELATRAQFHFETYWKLNKGYYARTFGPSFVKQTRRWGPPVWKIGAGANMAFRRSVFEQVGGFDERLDVGAAGCSGDSEFWYRVLADGGHCRYESTAVVYHHHRRTPEALKRQIYHYMRGHTAALLIQFEKHRHWSNLVRAFGALPYMYARKIVRRTLRGSPSEVNTLREQICGWGAGIKYYLSQRLQDLPRLL